ncbi:MAG TPA: ATP synthase F0 subunit C [Armatimonadaceae bacterium]|jgi:F-type H+-transporting ATPase subunit c|nr:ATP synthase F0 subunit C [Armatimonadaceae bacterium]
MLYLGMLALAVALALPIAAFGAALGQGKAAAAALEGIARQPEAAGKIQTAMILALAFMEALALFTLLTFFIMSGKLPGLTAEQAVQLAGSAAPGLLL